MLPHITGDRFIIPPIIAECAVDLAETSVTTLIPTGDLMIRLVKHVASPSLLSYVYKLSKPPLLEGDGQL